jgi:uncharacterized protein YeaO (DUF488 family)
VIKTERVYEHNGSQRGYRVLVDRLWPRGIKKEKVDLWLKGIAPSDELRKWYMHEPEKWPEFKKRYYQELKDNPDVERLLDIARKKDVLLLFASKEEKINNAVALKEYLDTRLKKGA